MEKLITINLSYYNQPKNTLLRHINTWKSYPENIKKKITFFIIDDCSKIPITDLIKDIGNIDLHIYRVKQDLYCNIAGVRNLGATECKTPYLVILDMDTVISESLIKSIIELATNNIDKNNAFKFNRTVPNDPSHIKNNKIHPAVCLIRKEDYWNIGGCEEDLVGHYGCTDPSFWYRSKGKVNILSKKNLSLYYYPDAESDINRDASHNKKLFSKKKKLDNWSTDFIRFKWEKVN